LPASRPRHADRDAPGRNQRREGGRLDAEVAKNRDDQRDIEQNRKARLHVARQRRIEALASQGATQQTERESNQPATDEPQGERARNPPGERGQRDDGTLREEVDVVHGFLRASQEWIRSVARPQRFRWRDGFDAG
jgi:hypothetical protein